METSLYRAPSSGSTVERYTADSPAWSVGSARGALLWQANPALLR
ncbi:hypothetical protein [Rhodoferax antarcticus]|nr:hypothetical protein [Rhodoferax antarcticus]